VVGSCETSGLTNVDEFLNHTNSCRLLKRPHSINLVNQITNFREQPVVVTHKMYSLQHDIDVFPTCYKRSPLTTTLLQSYTVLQSTAAGFVTTIVLCTRNFSFREGMVINAWKL
jgi:hypothetical protein